MHPGGQIAPFTNTLLIFLKSAPGGVGGIMVSIAAFQAVDPGSIHGRRIIFLSFDSVLTFKICILQTNEDGIHQKGHWGHCDT